MKELPLAIEGGSWLRIHQQTKELSRKYHTIKVENALTWSDKALTIFRTNGSEMRCLELTDCVFDIERVSMLNRMFGSFTRLESLQLSNVEIDCYDLKKLSRVKPVNLPHLKKLVLYDSNIAVSWKVFISFIEFHNLLQSFPAA
jgi:hypothetical protein